MKKKITGIIGMDCADAKAELTEFYANSDQDMANTISEQPLTVYTTTYSDRTAKISCPILCTGKCLSNLSETEKCKIEKYVEGQGFKSIN